MKSRDDVGGEGGEDQNRSTIVLVMKDHGHFGAHWCWWGVVILYINTINVYVLLLL